MKNLDLLIPKVVEAKDSFTWATVTALEPSLRVRFDGDTDASQAEPETMVYGLSVGDRVWCQRHGLRVLVLGKAGGVPPATTPWTTATLENGWTNIAFRRIPQYRLWNGAVRLRGSATNGTKDTTILTLPAGMRPDEQLTFPLVGSGQIEVNPDGVVKTYFASETTISLNVVSFMPDQ